MNNRPVIKPLAKWVKELGISAYRLRKWLTEDFDLNLQQPRGEYGGPLISEAYINKVLEKRMAKPFPVQVYNRGRQKFSESAPGEKERAADDRKPNGS